MGYIYKITNTVNDKLYIGQTIYTLKDRFRRHFYDAQKSDAKIYRAMKKHGFENFFISLIEEVDDELLDEREIYWIAHFDSYKHGYNSTIGGLGNACIEREPIRKLWDEGKSIKEIVSIIGCGRATVRSALKDHASYSIEESNLRGHKDLRTKVAQYTLDGDLVRVFDKISDAAMTFSGIEKGSIISKVCKEERGTAFGYQWRYADEKVEEKVSPTIINAGSNHIVEVDGKMRGLHEVCLELFDENAYASIKNYHHYSGCSIQESFERYVKTNGATRTGDIIVYNDVKYFDIVSASKAAGISKYRVYKVKTKLKCTPQEAFDYCLSKPPCNNGPIKVCINGITYKSFDEAIKSTGVNRTNFYKYKKEHKCSAQEAIEHLLNTNNKEAV